MKKLAMADSYRGNKTYPFPDEDIITQKQRDDPAYFVAACNAITSRFVNNLCWNYYDAISTRRPFWELRAYRYGQNSPNKYKDFMCGFVNNHDGVNNNGNQRPRNDEGGRRTTLNISWDVLQILPQKMDVVMGYMQKINYDVITSAIDYQALIGKKTMVAMAKLMADDKVRLGMKKEINKLAGREVIPDMDPSEMPGGMPFTNPKEVDMAAAVGVFFIQEEAAIKMLLDKTLYDSGWDGIADKLKDDFLTLGLALTIAKTNPNTMVVEEDYVDPEGAIIPYSRYNDYRDMTYFGQVRSITIGELKKKTDIPEIDLIKMARMYNNTNDIGIAQPGFYAELNRARSNMGFGMNMLDQIEVDIVECRWLGKKNINYTSVNRERDGTLVLNKVNEDYDLKKVRNRDGKKLHNDSGMTIYKATMILGTSQVYDYGEDNDISYKTTSDGRKFPVFPVKCVRSGNSSLVERCISFVDDANLDNYKLRVARMRMPAPPNLVIRKSALENVKIDGVDFKPSKLMRILSDEGFLIIDDQNGWGNTVTSGKAIDTIPTDIIKQLAEWRLDMEWNFSMIERVTGINEIFSAQTPTSEQGLGVSNLLMAATNNALTPVIKAYEYIFEQSMRICASKWQVVAKYMPEETRKKLSINRALSYVKVGSDLNDYDFDIRIQAGMTDAEKAELIQDISKMRDLRRQAGTGGITEADWLLIRTTIQNGNIAQAQLLLAQISEIRQRQDEEKQDKLVGMNAQAQQASNQQTADNKIQEIGVKGEVEGQNKLQEINAQFMADMALQQQKAQDDRRSLALQNVFGNQKSA